MKPRTSKPSPSDVIVVGKRPFEALWKDVGLQALPPAPPASEGWMSVVQIAKVRAIRRSAAANMVARLYADGRLERMKARSAYGNHAPTYFYRPVKS